MDWLRRLIADFREVWTHSNLQTRATLVASLFLVALTLIGLVMLQTLMTKPNLVPAISNLEPGQTAEIVQHLRGRNIPAEANKDQTAVLVPAGREAEAAAEAVIGGVAPKESGVTWEIFNRQQIGMTRLLHNVYFARAMETQLANSLKASHGLRQVVVNLAIPQSPTLFEEDKPTASVMVDGSLSPSQVHSIQSYVAGAVVGMDANGVTVTDFNLTPLSEMTEITATSETDKRFQFKTQWENYEAARIVKMIAPIVGGRDNIRANVTLQPDWERIDTEIAASKDPIPSEKSSTTETTTGSRPGAEPGVASNVPGATRTAPVTENVVTNSKTTTETKFALTVEKINQSNAPGNYLKSPPSAVIAVNSAFKDAENNEMTLEPAVVAQIRSMVEGILAPLKPEVAAGAEVTAGSQMASVVVEALPFVIPPPEKVEVVSFNLPDILRYGEQYLPTLVIVIIGFLAFRQFRKILRAAPVPVHVPVGGPEGVMREGPPEEVPLGREFSLSELGIRSPEDIAALPAEEQRRIKLQTQVTDWAKVNPAKVAGIIKTWLHE